jgi:LacI family transcriptional regulator
VVARRSSDTVAVSDPVVAAAVRFIRDNATRPIGVPDVVAELGVPRRALERAFREALGHAPAAEIRQIRLRLARDVLVTTGLGMAEVARRSGFADAKQFSAAFGRLTGMTPTAYRAAGRLPRGASGSQISD